LADGEEAKTNFLATGNNRQAMRRSIRCQPPHAEDHHDFANFQAFMSPPPQKQPPPKYTYATTTTTTMTPSKLTYGNPLQFVPSASHAAGAHQHHRGAKMSPDNAFRPPPQQQHYNSPINKNKTPASPATSGSSSYVAWPSSISPEEELVLHESFTMHRQQQQYPVKPQDTSRQTTALTTSMASSFDDDEEEEIPSWEEFHHGAGVVAVTAPRPTSWSATQYQHQQRAAGGATSRRPVPSLRVARSVQQPSALPSLRSTTAPTTRSVQQQEEDDFDHYPDPDISVGMHNSDEEEEEPPQQRPAKYQQTHQQHQHHHYRGAPAPRLSHDALRYKESLEPTMLYPTPLAKGFCGLFDKTKAVPCLLDDTEESTTLDEDSDHNNSHRHNDDSPRIFRELHNSRNNDAEALSDVFDGIISDPPSNNRSSNNPSTDRLFENRSPSPHRQVLPQQQQAAETIPKAFAMVRLKGGLSAIQTTPDMFRNRTTKSVMSDNSTDDDGGSSTGTDGSSIPDHHTMVSAGRRLHDNAVYGIHTNILSNVQRCPKPTGTTTTAVTTTASSSSYHHQRTNKTHHAHSSPYDESSSDNDGEYNDHCGYYWYQYRVDPASTAELVRTYRELSAQVSTARLLSGDTGYEWEDDERKIFALSEMRSRIMEKDLERGLERRGGTLTTDDLVTTSYHRTSHRIRDALIVSKAWRDGATVSDVIRTEQLTRKHLVHSVRRVNQQQRAVISYEPVAWRDDTDFHQYRCPSLSGRQMRGGEMYTIGDCQSILLKLTNDRCMVRFLCTGSVWVGSREISFSRRLPFCLPCYYSFYRSCATN
jgi:hypothetical protein